MKDRLQEQRFEIKFRVHEYKALEIRHFVERYLAIDPFGATQPDLSYPVHSLYIDSQSMKTYQDTINGNRNRYKLRIRYYENGPDAPVFFEIKRRFDKVIAKKRAKVKRRYVQELLTGQMPIMEHLIKQTPKELEALEHFCFLVNQIHARPKIHVAYRREAYELEDNNSVRVTFDRDVRTKQERGYSLATEMKDGADVFGNKVILELKFTNRFPDWFRELTQRFDLRQDSAAKYVDGILKIGPGKLVAV
ncbi:VTC domain-containing protein [Rhodohalobacter sp. SW132]|uniref:polyphosphate polymerase domain-containing protein n=1 Tax=Rhodohalobacter sp. SW132 TaxID=2293433 RepID=UPI000E284A01|nr:polyphosphate polymerase domain-containing protein [Rhodohalobacter sp. SW132]REL38345.1 VTC domain-containing protein [Rhodohalobacter sp. SW132]